MLDFVPLARPRWKMTDRDGQACFIREGPQLHFLQAQPPAIAPPAVGRNQDRGGRRIELLAFLAPPSPDGRHRKLSRVVTGFPHSLSVRVGGRLSEACVDLALQR